MSEGRYRIWKFVLWKESAPFDYINRIHECGVRVLLSPLHNQDPSDDGDGYKKAHHHGIMIYSGVKTYNQALDKAKEFGGDGINTVLVCDDLYTSTRYLCHLDHPWKHIYPIRDIKEFNGASVEDAFSSQNDIRRYDLQIFEFINDNNVLYYHDLVEYSSLVNPEWKDAVCKRTIYWTAYLKARSTAIERGQYDNITRKTIEEFRKL